MRRICIVNGPQFFFLFFGSGLGLRSKVEKKLDTNQYPKNNKGPKIAKNGQILVNEKLKTKIFRGQFEVSVNNLPHLQFYEYSSVNI